MASMAIADETMSVLTVGTNAYKHVSIFKVSATDIYFTSDKGLANAKLKDLDREMQKHFNYNPTNAAAADQRQKAGNALYHIQSLQPSGVGRSANTNAAANEAAIGEPGTGKKIWARSFLNQKAPELVVEKWLNGDPNLQGKFVLIDFWATWDPASRLAILELNKFHHDFGGKLVVIGVSDEPEDVVLKLADPVIGYYVAIDTQARMKSAVEVTGIPHVLVIDPQGIVRWEGFPFLQGFELNEKVLADIIAQYSD